MNRGRSVLNHPPTPRQREVIRCSWHGLGTRETAALLGISPHTAHEHRREAYQRLGIAGLADPRTRAAVWLWQQENT